MRKAVYDVEAAKLPVNVTLNSDLVARARAEGLNLSTLAEEAVPAALAPIAEVRFDDKIAQACQMHEQYLAEYGSLGDAVRASADADAYAPGQTWLAGRRAPSGARFSCAVSAGRPVPTRASGSATFSCNIIRFART
jgi:antitoxin CcdA